MCCNRENPRTRYLLLVLLYFRFTNQLYADRLSEVLDQKKVTKNDVEEDEDGKSTKLTHGRIDKWVYRFYRHSVDRKFTN